MDIHLKFTEFSCLFVPKNLRSKKRFGPRNFGVQQFLSPKVWFQKNFEFKKSYGKKILGPKVIWVPEERCDSIKIWRQKKFGSKNFGLKKILGLKKIWVQKKFYYKKLLGTKK